MRCRSAQAVFPVRLVNDERLQRVDGSAQYIASFGSSSAAIPQDDGHLGRAMCGISLESGIQYGRKRV